ncbi:hypothetical protein [Fontivita pretiosa]|uniref:hypothetical protein n=1 Tax=Fontivita pretiosa TaxID=2989684 RepID=UPI003D1702CA
MESVESLDSQTLQQTLGQLDRLGRLVRHDAHRQVWSFAHGGREYYLYFYPRPNAFGSLLRRGGAFAEFVRFQQMQRAAVPVPRAIAHLAGLRIGQQLGDALIVEAISGAVPLGTFLRERRLSGQPLPASQRRAIAAGLVEILYGIGRARFGHPSLSLDSFLVRDDRLWLLDVRQLRRGGLRLAHLFSFAHDAARFATRTELLRGWLRLNPDDPWPRKNPLSEKLWRRQFRHLRGRDWGRLRAGPWSGLFTQSSRWAVAWSLASRLGASRRDWELAWPMLLAQIQSDQLTVLKSDSSGQVLAGQVVLAGRPIAVVVKRPRRKAWHRYVLDLFRPARARRMWLKAWQLIVRQLPCEWPLLLMERRVLGYVIDAIVVFEHVPGESLDRIDLDSTDPQRRDMLFRRLGRTLRRIERSGLAHYDAKSTNWIVFDDSHDPAGPTPVMIDTDGIRPLNYWLVSWGIRRLLRAMKQHPQYTAEDSLALCQGYAPFARGQIGRQS